MFNNGELIKLSLTAATIEMCSEKITCSILLMFWQGQCPGLLEESRTLGTTIVNLKRRQLVLNRVSLFSKKLRRHSFSASWSGAAKMHYDW